MYKRQKLYTAVDQNVSNGYCTHYKLKPYCTVIGRLVACLGDRVDSEYQKPHLNYYYYPIDQISIHFCLYRRCLLRRRHLSERWLPTAGDPLQFGRIRVLMALTAIPGVFEYRMGADTGTAFQSRTEHSTEL